MLIIFPLRQMSLEELMAYYKERQDNMDRNSTTPNVDLIEEVPSPTKQQEIRIAADKVLLFLMGGPNNLRDHLIVSKVTWENYMC